MKITCAACGKLIEFPEKAGFRDTCPSCDAYVHSCLNCSLYVKGHCTEPSAEKVSAPEGMNFCEWFREIAADFADEREEGQGRDTAEEMWKKLTGKK